MRRRFMPREGVDMPCAGEIAGKNKAIAAASAKARFIAIPANMEDACSTGKMQPLARANH
jgi:hypothetical protein